MYKNEIEINLDDKKAKVLISKYFIGLTNQNIVDELGITTSNVSGIIREARMTLIRKSMLFRNEYRRIHEISDYNTEKMALYEA